ncbi:MULTISPECIES: IPExxxVDY family protein [Capnocytophaga]|uniref:IPExxxVDY family protein n=1 Tax=Capnocytophaga canis TaxID=1848903 RepID=A0A3A1YF49_9FLAO|nr:MULTISPECIES: IPExxxVDY family protein [Capnocytophaga]ATA72543.1 hypothetical protein CGC49_04065 [Capnocytophaga sp. H4358]RIY35899.1 IPExxxVDY family protein [Capnocytophaga canis]CEN45630.1 conserved hypothetical protein [Capnocytophaga canis]
MATYKLSNDWFDDTFKLIAIHTTLEDFRLVYFLNNHLKINLSRNKKKKIVNEQNSVPFPYFEWYDELSDVNWHCISNKVNVENNIKDSGLLFDSLYTASYLLKDKKKVDFFLKIDCDNRFKTQNVLDKVNEITQVIAYEIDTYTLNTKNKLILQGC